MNNVELMVDRLRDEVVQGIDSGTVTTTIDDDLIRLEIRDGALRMDRVWSRLNFGLAMLPRTLVDTLVDDIVGEWNDGPN